MKLAETLKKDIDNYVYVVSQYPNRSDLLVELGEIVKSKREKQELIENDAYFENFEGLLAHMFMLNFLEKSTYLYSDPKSQKNPLTRKAPRGMADDLINIYEQFQKLSGLHMHSS